jgi:hypothetical protein
VATKRSLRPRQSRQLPRATSESEQARAQRGQLGRLDNANAASHVSHNSGESSRDSHSLSHSVHAGGKSKSIAALAHGRHHGRLTARGKASRETAESLATLAPAAFVLP